MESNQERASLRQFVLKHIEIGFDALKAIVVYFGRLVVHRHQIFVVLPDIFGLGVVAALED